MFRSLIVHCKIWLSWFYPWSLTNQLNELCRHGPDTIDTTVNIIELAARGANYGTQTLSCIWQPIHSACYRGHAVILKTLLNLGADGNAFASDKRTPLMTVLAFNEFDNDECAYVLLQHGVDLECQTEQDGFTALHLAVIYKRVSIVNTLLIAGADMDIADKWGKTPLQYISTSLMNETDALIEVEFEKCSNHRMKDYVSQWKRCSYL